MAEPLAETAAPAAAEPTEQAAPAAEPSAPAAEPAADAPASEPTGEPGSEPAKPLGEKGVEELKSQRKKRQDAEREAAYWRGVAEGRVAAPAQQQAPPQPVQPQGPPDSNQFENWDDYLVAKTKYEIRQEQAVENSRRWVADVNKRWSDRVAKAKEAFPEIETELRETSAMISGTMELMIKNSERGPELARHLALNPNVAARIATLDPVSTAYELGKLETQLAAAPVVKTNKISQAPEPIRGVAPKGSFSPFDPEKSSIDEFMKKRNEQAPPGRR